MAKGLFTSAGDRLLAAYLFNQVSHIAVGNGTWVDKFNPPAENYPDDVLTSELGRVPVTDKEYLMEDTAGTLVFAGDGTNYRMATAAEILAAANDVRGALGPSKHVMFKCIIPANVATGKVICEIGLFVGSQTQTAGFALPAQIVQAGHMVYNAHIGAITVEADTVIERWIRVIQ